MTLVSPSECKQRPGEFRPVIDRNRCEGKADCERVCPVAVFKVDTLPKDMRGGINFKGKLKAYAHQWQQALVINGDACEACGLCVKACPENAITLVRV